MNSKSNSALTTFAPIIADLAALLLYFLSVGWMVGRFGRNALDFTALNDAGILVGFHFLFLIGIWQLTKLPGKMRYSFLSNRYFQGLFAVIYAVAFVMGVADLTGYLDTLFTVEFGDMGNGYYFLITPAVYLFVGLLYLFILRQPTDQTANADKVSLPTLLLLNGMLVAAAAFLHAFLLTRFESLSPVVIGLITYVILGIIFLLPRLLFAAKRQSLISLLSYDLLITALAILSAVSFPV